MPKRIQYKPGSESFEIETGIPVPEPHVPQKKLLNTLATLNVGDSFFVPEAGSPKQYNNMYGMVSFYERRYHEDFYGIVRFEADEDGLVGLRVWRGEDRKWEGKKR